MKYQLFPNLTADEMEALTADVKERGVMVPVEVDENGDILDGHHRAMIADSLGITYPTVVREGWTEDQKLVHVVALNAHRRHLSAIERSEVVGRLRKERLSVRAIAKAVGVPKSTVHDDIAGVRVRTPGDLPSTTAGSDGRTYSATRPFRPRLDPAPDPYFIDRAAKAVATQGEREVHRAAMALMPPDPDAERAAKADAWTSVIRKAGEALHGIRVRDYAEFLDAKDRAETDVLIGLIEDWIGWTRSGLSEPLRLVRTK